MKAIQPWVQTFSGLKFWLTNPTPETIDIEHIAHCLAQQCRYTGSTKEHYSVAQHSFIVSHIVPKELALSALMHDSEEAYTGDQNKPYKDLVGTSFSRYVNRNITIAIYDKFNIRPYHFDCPEIKEADLMVLRAEALQVLTHPPIDNWHIDLPKKEIIIAEWSWRMAEGLFLKRFLELYKGE